MLHKPENFVKGRRYPLMIVIHGGPSSYSRPSPVDEWGNDVPYPIEVWLKKGALVLEPNYRGSLGYGEAFKSLILGKLGQGEPQDIVSGIDALVKEGIVDNDKVGVAGWSYGGYLTALLSVRYPQRFKAASAGAGITDWQTDYVNSDIDDWFHAFFRSTPWDDPTGAWTKGSPMTYIKDAHIPTLIQHGADDPRVPIANSKEFYRALQDLKVPSRLIFYKGMGHILDTPRAMRAAMSHNLAWFDQYLLSPEK